MKTPRPLKPVTERQLEILTWLSQGKTVIETSLIMGIPFGTVKYEIQMCGKKLNANGMTHTVANALRQELIT